MALQLFDLHKRKCKQCGKEFEGRMEYAYKIEKRKGTQRYLYFCSWRCLQKYRYEHKQGA